MAFPILTEQARAQKLHGSDVYRRSSILYLDALHQHWGAVSLNVEARLAFADTIALTHWQALAQHQKEMNEWVAKGAFIAGLDMPRSAVFNEAMEYSNYEHLKLASGFELHLKARLLSAGYVVHRLDSRDGRFQALARAQQSRPVSAVELRAIQEYQFDGQINFLPGLTSSSLKFSWLTREKAYREALKLPDATLDIIEDYRQLRNQIHLPGEHPDTPAIREFGRSIISFLLPFVNEEIVAWSNRTIDTYDFRFNKLKPFA